MNGQTLSKAFVGLPGGGVAVYNSSGLLYYGHADHLGSVRLGSTPSRTMYFDLAHAPFGETYATSGTLDPDFTGQRSDTVSGLFDFPAREYSNEGRWHSPDPAGLAVVDPTNPQSWNRYAYVLNSPLNLIDPSGLDTCGGPNNPCLSGVACRYPQNWSKCKGQPPGISNQFGFSYGDMEFEFMSIGSTVQDDVIIGYILASTRNNNQQMDLGGCGDFELDCQNTEIAIYGTAYSYPNIGLIVGMSDSTVPGSSGAHALANSLRPRTEREYNACLAQADAQGKNQLIGASIEQAAGIGLTVGGVYIAFEAIPSLNTTFFKGMHLEHLFDFAHGGSFGYFGATGPIGVGTGVFGKGTVDVANAYDQYNRAAALCGGPVGVTP